MRPVDRIPAYADAIDGTARCHTSAGEPKVLPPTPETRVRNARAASLPREMVVCVTQRRKKKKKRKLDKHQRWLRLGFEITAALVLGFTSDARTQWRRIGDFGGLYIRLGGSRVAGKK